MGTQGRRVCPRWSTGGQQWFSTPRPTRRQLQPPWSSGEGGFVPFGCCCGFGLVPACMALWAPSSLPPPCPQIFPAHASLTAPLSLANHEHGCKVQPGPGPANRCLPVRAGEGAHRVRRGRLHLLTEQPPGCTAQARLPHGEGHRSAAQRCPDTAWCTEGKPRSLQMVYLSGLCSLHGAWLSALLGRLRAGFVPPHPLCPSPFAVSCSE